MKHYLVRVIWANPYPKEYSYNIAGSNIAVAIAKGVRQFRREVKGRKVTNLKVYIDQYASQINKPA